MRFGLCLISALSVATLVTCKNDNPVAAKYKPSFVTSTSTTPVPYRALATGRGNGGSLQVILLGAKDSLPYLIYQTTGGSWYSHGKLPDPNGVQLSAVATGRGNNGYLQVIGIGAKDSLLYLIWQDGGGGWNWYGHRSAFGTVKFSAIAAGSGNNDYLQVIGIGAKDSLPYLIWQDGGGGWHWYGRVSDPNGVKFRAITTAARASSPYYLQVILLGATDYLPYLIWQDGNGGWHWWGYMNDPGVPFSVIAADTGNFPPEVVVIGIGKKDLLPYALGSNVGYLSPWYGQLPGGVPFGAIAAGDGNDQMLQVIGLGANDGLPYLTWLDKYGNWNWRGPLPDPNGVPFTAAATGNGNGASLQVILLGRNDGLPYLIYQTTGGAWYWHGQLPDP